MTDYKNGYGAVLRRRREEMGLSLDDVAASTRVRKTYLNALEEENLKGLPGAAYAVGFLRIYARQLNLAADPLLAALAGSAPLVTAEDGAPTLLQEPGRAAGRSRGKGRGIIRFLILLVIIAGAAGGYLYFSQKSTPPAKPLTPAAEAPKEVPSPQPSPPAQPVVQVTPTAPAAVPAEGQPAIVPVDLPVLPAEGAVVRMTPLAAGVGKISLDGQEVREYQLQPGQALNWKVTGSLAVELSAPGLVKVQMEQQELAVAEHQAFILKKAPLEKRP